MTSESPGVPVEGRKPDQEEKVSFGTVLPPDLIKQVKKACQAREVRMQDAVEEALRDWLLWKGAGRTRGKV